MNKEIGGEFWDIPTTNKKTSAFVGGSQWFASGRSALKGIIGELEWAKTVAMPSWCCDSIILPFLEAGKEVVFYPVIAKNGLLQDVNVECDVLFLIDYFGFQSINDVQHKCVIRDVTHSVFSDELGDADYYFGSLRKWCGVRSGGFAWTSDSHKLQMDDNDSLGYFELRRKAMRLKKRYVDSGYVGEEKREFLHYYSDAEALLDGIGSARADSSEMNDIYCMDTEWIRKKRRENAEVLMNELGDYLVFQGLNSNNCPLFVPIVVDADIRNRLHKHLVGNNVFCPMHWPISKLHRLDDKTMDVYNREISIVCDQRYSKEDMVYIANTIKCFFNKCK